MMSSTPPTSSAGLALNAAFNGTGFSALTTHGDSYGIPHGSAAVHAAVAASEPPDTPMGASAEKRKKPKIGSPGAKPAGTGGGTAIPVLASPRSSGPQDSPSEARLRAVELRLSAAEARLDSDGGLIAKLDAFASDFLIHRGEADRRVEAIAAAQQGGMTEIDQVMTGKLAVIEAAFGLPGHREWRAQARAEPLRSRRVS